LHLLRKEASGGANPDQVREATALVTRLGRVARTAAELNAAADTLNQLGKSAESLPLAERAAKLAPYDADVLDTQATALFNLDRVAEAVEVQTAAVAFMDEDERDPGILQRLELYKSRAE
jgi:tetratricopeptide (TPR) repeat protein